MGTRVTTAIGLRFAAARLRVVAVRGVTISLHWSWLLCVGVWVAWRVRAGTFSWWWLLELAGIFAIVVLHELGHATAARLIGQRASEVILWPLGGLATVEFPARWSKQLFVSAAGPVVNVVLVPITFAIWYTLGYRRGGKVSAVLWHLFWANNALLLFNILPVMPLDGGRITQAALTAWIGMTRSTMYGSIAGLVIAAAAIKCCMRSGAILAVALLAGFTFLIASMLHWSLQMLAYERRWGFHPIAVRPACGNRALGTGEILCPQCEANVDALSTGGTCPHCGAGGLSVSCPYCDTATAAADWCRGNPAQSASGTGEAHAL